MTFRAVRRACDLPGNDPGDRFGHGRAEPRGLGVDIWGMVGEPRAGGAEPPTLRPATTSVRNLSWRYFFVVQKNLGLELRLTPLQFRLRKAWSAHE